ncbi:hypothetical protein K0U27_00245 [archaeon]|nr:hypothetical protein [archaeon]
MKNSFTALITSEIFMAGFSMHIFAEETGIQKHLLRTDDNPFGSIIGISTKSRMMTH